MKEQLKQLENRYQLIRIARLTQIPIIIGAIVCGFLASTGGGIALTLVLGMLQFGFIHPQNKKYVRDCNRFNLEQTLRTKLHADEPLENEGITTEDVREAELFPIAGGKKALLGFWRMSGWMSSYPVTLSDICIYYEYLAGDGKNQGSFAGCWVQIGLPEKICSDWVVMDGEFMEQPARDEVLVTRRGMDKLPLPEEKQNERFAFYLAPGSPRPSDNVLKKIMELADYTPGKICAQLRDNKLHILLRYRVLAGNVNVNVLPNEKNLLRDPLPELEYIRKLADAAIRA